ncbi:MAG: ORF6N domain-containing protein [Chitinophagaceae bacterium]
MRGINEDQSIQLIRSKIHEIRGQKVMLDYDLATLYHVETKMLKRAVKRNAKRFPSDFMLELTLAEYNTLRYQFGTLKQGSHSKYLPFAFTDHGVTMLSSVLNSDRAIEMNIAIVRAFVSLKQIDLRHRELAEKLDQIKASFSGRLDEHDTQLNAIYEAIENMLEEKVNQSSWNDRNRIGFK